MSQFSLKTFLRKTPYSLIKQYFEPYQMLADYPWPATLDIDALGTAIEQLGDRGEIVVRDFQSINAIATEKGSLHFLENADTFGSGAVIKEAFASMKSHHERAMWMFMEYPDEFRCAAETMYLDSIASWKHCIVGNSLSCRGDEETLQKLRQAISEYYRQQGRGKNCTVDYYCRNKPLRHCFFAYPENFVTETLTYDDAGQLVRQPGRQAFEIVFVYHCDTGLLDIHAKGANTIRALQEIFCRHALGLSGIPDLDTMVYDLSRLKEPIFQFSHNPDDGIDSVLLKMVMIELPGVGEKRITFEAKPKIGTERLVFNMVDEMCRNNNVSRDEAVIKKAKITVNFARVNGRRGKHTTFTISIPDSCELGDEPHHNIIKKYLVQWGFFRRVLANKEDAA